MPVPTIQVPCGCVFEAEGEMNMVKYCPECEAAMAGQAEVHSCEDCPLTFGSAEELEDHFVQDHLGYVRSPLVFVIPAGSPTPGLRRAS